MLELFETCITTRLVTNAFLRASLRDPIAIELFSAVRVRLSAFSRATAIFFGQARLFALCTGWRARVSANVVGAVGFAGEAARDARVIAAVALFRAIGFARALRAFETRIVDARLIIRRAATHECIRRPTISENLGLSIFAQAQRVERAIFAQRGDHGRVGPRAHARWRSGIELGVRIDGARVDDDRRSA
jgi:hypothetical protein